MSGPEKIWENKLKAYLKSKGYYVVKVPGGSQVPKGTPDLIVCGPNGRFLGLELKAPMGRTSALQKHHIMEIRNSGGYARVLKESDFEDFKKELDAMVEA